MQQRRLHRLMKLSILLARPVITEGLLEIGQNVHETSRHVGSTHFSYVELEDEVVVCVVSSAAIHSFFYPTD